MSIVLRATHLFHGKIADSASFPLALLLTTSLLWLPSATAGQAAGVNQGGPGYLHGQAGSDPMAQHGSPDGADKLEQMRKAEMHRRVLADAARLLQLSGELKVELDQTPKDQLSLGAIRKAAEIEKLAHSIKDGLRY